MKKTIFAFALLFSLLLVSCSSQETVRSKTFYDYFDTVVTVSGCDADFDATAAKIEEILKKYHLLCDIYGDGMLADVNKNAGKTPVKVTDELFELLTCAKEAYAKTNGKSNVAFGTVTLVWHEYRERALDGDVAVPTSEELREAAEHTDIDALVLDEAEKTVFFRDPMLRLDLGAFAKGFVADVIERELVSLGKTSYAISVGGTIVVTGEKSNGVGWTVGVENPDPTSNEPYAARVVIDGGVTLATSGSYQRFYELDGVRYHHIIDTETLAPKNEFLSVTVASDSAFVSDAFSTAIYCMSLEEGRLFADENGVSVLWVLADGTIEMTSDFEKMTKEP